MIVRAWLVSLVVLATLAGSACGDEPENSTTTAPIDAGAGGADSGRAGSGGAVSGGSGGGMGGNGGPLTGGSGGLAGGGGVSTDGGAGAQPDALSDVTDNDEDAPDDIFSDTFVDANFSDAPPAPDAADVRTEASGPGADSGSTADVADANDGGSPDPCNGVPTSGRCVASNEVEYCSIPTGQGVPSVVKVRCTAFESCTVSAGGTASCTPLPTMCTPGASRCTGTMTAETCTDNAHWTAFACPQCRESPLGALCPGGVSVVGWNGILRYETRTINSSSNPTDWGAPFAVPAQGMLVVSYVWDASAQTYNPIDATTTDGQGSFAIQIPSSPGPEDQLVFFALHTRSGTTNVDYAVARPGGVVDGQAEVWEVDGASSRIWQWSAKVMSLGVSGGTLIVTEALFSGPMRLFDWMRYSLETSEAVMGSPGVPVVVWIRFNTSWSCGACELGVPITMGSMRFGAQIFMPAVAQDLKFYADPVTTHEAGHWVMQSWGTFPGEGGPHVFSCPTFPGQAWSEGWATYFSTLARTNALYYDKAGGTFFWLNVASRVYSSGASWLRPTTGAGLLQMLDENEVTATLWSMSDQTGPALERPANAAFFAALRSHVVNRTPGSTYSRGYTRHTWNLTGSGCGKINVVDTGVSRMHFADYLDALVCNGFDATRVDSATVPTTHYPYPSQAPICN
jgi:hypothetical protein